MPDYTIRDPVSGRTVTVRGDTPPTDSDLDEIFAGLPPPSRDPRAIVGDVVKDLAIGAAKGAGGTVKELADLGRKYIPGMAALDRFGKVQVGDTLEPTNTAQSIGRGAERIAEFAAPSRAVAAGAARLAPKVALALGQRAAPLVARGAVEAASAAPIAALHGDNPLAAAATAGVMPAAAAGAGALLRKGGRAAVEHIVKPSAAQLRTMVGESAADKTARIVNTVLRVGASPRAQQKAINLEEGIVDELLAQRGAAPTQAPALIGRRLDELTDEYAKGALPRENFAAVEDARADLLGPRAPLARDVQTGVQQVPTGILEASGKMGTREAPVMGRALREDISARDAIDVARATARQRRLKSFGELKSAPVEASKTVELALRDAAKEAVPAIVAPMQRISHGIEARDVLENQRAPDMLTMLGGKTGLALRLAKALQGQFGRQTFRAGDPTQQLLDNPIVRALLTRGAGALGAADQEP